MAVVEQGNVGKHEKNEIIQKLTKSQGYSVQESILRFCLGHATEIYQLSYCYNFSKMLQCVYFSLEKTILYSRLVVEM